MTGLPMCFLLLLLAPSELQAIVGTEATHAPLSRLPVHIRISRSLLLRFFLGMI